MAFTAKILSWRFRHLNIVGCFLKRRPTKGGSRAHPPPPSYAPDSNVERASHYRFKSFLLTRRVSGAIVSNPSKAYMSKAKASNQLGNKGGKAVRALASQQCGPGSNLGVNAICELSLLMIPSSDPRGFSPRTFCYC